MNTISKRRRNEFRDAARLIGQQATSRDDFEVDERARVDYTPEDGSAWVQCWIYVPCPDPDNFIQR